MAALIRKAYYGYQMLFHELPDPRTRSWPLVAKPYQGMLIIGLYLMFVFRWGPAWMKDRRPFNLEKLLIVYNALQVISCAYMFYGAIVHAWGWKYKWICEPVDYSESEEAMTVANIVYLYYLSKVLDLLDTVFFVLRKKFNQVTFLHVYHHSGMVLLMWGATTYHPGGHATLVGVINCFVHIVMYGYYLLTVAYPVYKQSLWWKKYITQLQIVQFFWCSVHMGVIVFKPDCEYPRWTAAVFLPQNLFMLILFLDFYIKTYIKKPALKLNGTKEEKNGVVHQNGKQNGTTGQSNGTHKVKSVLNGNGVERNGVSEAKKET